MNTGADSFDNDVYPYKLEAPAPQPKGETQPQGQECHDDGYETSNSGEAGRGKPPGDASLAPEVDAPADAQPMEAPEDAPAAPAPQPPAQPPEPPAPEPPAPDHSPGDSPSPEPEPEASDPSNPSNGNSRSSEEAALREPDPSFDAPPVQVRQEDSYSQDNVYPAQLPPHQQPNPYDIGKDMLSQFGPGRGQDHFNFGQIKREPYDMNLTEHDPYAQYKRDEHQYMRDNDPYARYKRPDAEMYGPGSDPYGAFDASAKANAYAAQYGHGPVKREPCHEGPEALLYNGLKREADDPYSFVDDEAVCALLAQQQGHDLSLPLPPAGHPHAHPHAHAHPHTHPLTPAGQPDPLMMLGAPTPQMLMGAPKKRGRKKKLKDENGMEIKQEGMDMMTALPKPVKERKKHDRFNGMSEEEVSRRTLPDHLAENLDIIIIGINPGLFAAYKGHHYAGPGNHFWKCLYLSGLTREQMSADEDYKLLHFGIGFTNMVQRATKGSADLTRREIKEGSAALLEKIQTYRPKIAVFNGKLIYEVFSGKKDFCFGKQSETVHGTNTYMWVMPSSSARCAQLPRAADKVPFYAALKKFRDYLAGTIHHLDEAELVFPDTTCRRPHEEIEARRLTMGPDAPCDTMILEDGTEVPMKKKRGRPKKIKLENGEAVPPAPRAPRAPRAPQALDGPDGEQPPKKKRGRPKKIRPEEQQFLLQQQQQQRQQAMASATPLPSMPGMGHDAGGDGPFGPHGDFERGPGPGAYRARDVVSPYFGGELGPGEGALGDQPSDLSLAAAMGPGGPAYAHSPAPYSLSPRPQAPPYGRSPLPQQPYGSPQRRRPVAPAYSRSPAPPPSAYPPSPAAQFRQTSPQRLPYARSPQPQPYAQPPPPHRSPVYARSPVAAHPYSQSPAPQSANAQGPPYSDSPGPHPGYSQSPAPQTQPYSQSPAPQGQPYSQSPAPQGQPYSQSPAPQGQPYSQSPAPQGGQSYRSPSRSSYSQHSSPAQSQRSQSYSNSPVSQTAPSLPLHPAFGNRTPQSYGQNKPSPPDAQNSNSNHNSSGGSATPQQQYAADLSSDISAAIASPGPPSPGMGHIDFEPPIATTKIRVPEPEPGPAGAARDSPLPPGDDGASHFKRAQAHFDRDDLHGSADLLGGCDPLMQMHDSPHLPEPVSAMQSQNSNRHSALNLIGPPTSSASNLSASQISSPMDPLQNSLNLRGTPTPYSNSLYAGVGVPSPLQHEQRLGFQVPQPANSANSSYGADLSGGLTSNSPKLQLDGGLGLGGPHERLSDPYGYQSEQNSRLQEGQPTMMSSHPLHQHPASAMYATQFNRSTPPHHPLGHSSPFSPQSGNGGGAFRGISQQSVQSLDNSGGNLAGSGMPQNPGGSPGEYAAGAKGGRKAQDVASKSLSGLESLVDQIPSIAEGGGGGGGGEAAGGAPAAPAASPAPADPYAALYGAGAGYGHAAYAHAPAYAPPYPAPFAGYPPAPYPPLMRPTPAYLPDHAHPALTHYHPAHHSGYSLPQQYGGGGPAYGGAPAPNYPYYNGYGPPPAMQAANVPYLSSHVLDHIHKNSADSSVSFGGFC